MGTVMGFLVLSLMAIPVAAADDAEFAFNLLSDIAPVLALFGDQFARQFTSESLTWVDHLIFAMVPLGIITAITGAIRIQGSPIAKAFIGRARENRAQAEIELMSSTSGEVCEIFNGSSIVRAMGNPQIAQFLIFPRQYVDCVKSWERFDRMTDSNPPESDPQKISCGIHSLKTAQKEGHVECKEYLGRGTEAIQSLSQNLNKQFRKLYKGLYSAFKESPTASNNASHDTESSRPDGTERPRDLPPGAYRAFRAPNIQLNHTSVHFDKRWLKKHNEIFLAAIAGILLQTGLIAIAAMVAYHIDSKSSELFESKPYGFPCYAAGSLLLSIGTGLCSFIVEHSTDEYSWNALVGGNEVSEEDAPRLLWLQNKQSVSDQSFNGYVIAAGPKRRIVTSSRTKDPERHQKSEDSENTTPDDSQDTFWGWLTAGAALSAALGFTAQFMGLRGLAFPCSIAQLGAIFIMALIRAAIRRRLGDPLKHCHAFQWYEIDLLAIRIVFDKGPKSLYWISQDDPEGLDPKGCFNWRIVTADPQENQFRLFVRLANHPITRTSDEAPQNGRGEADGETFTSPTSQHLLRVRRRLGDLTHWKTRSSISAVALVQSIELVMNEFFPPSSEIKSLNWLVNAVHTAKIKTYEVVSSHSRQTETRDRKGVETTKTTTCEIRVPHWTEKENHDVVQFKIARKKPGGGFEVEAGLIDAALSLWMARIDAKKPQAVASGSEEGKKNKDWRREKSGNSLTYEFYRIIGNNFQDDVLKRDISWWVDNLTAKRSEPQPKEKSKSGKGEKLKTDAKVVIGFNGIAANTPQNDQVNTGDSPDEDKPTELGIYSEGSLPTILAQHLFTSFMWTVAQHLPEDCLQPQDGDNQQKIEVNRYQAFESFDIDQTWPKLKLNHQRLDKLVNMMETYGMGNRTDILLCIIPALSARRLLPNQVVLKLVPQMKRGLGWSEIATCHMRLLEMIKRDKMSIDDRLEVGIVVTAMDFLSFACENYYPADEQSQELDMNLRDIVVKLASDKFTDIFQKLGPVYLRQQRREMFRNIFKRFDCKDPMQGYAGRSDGDNVLDSGFARRILEFTKHHFEAYKDSKSLVSTESSYNTRSNGIIDFLLTDISVNQPTTTKDIFGWTPYHYLCSNADNVLFWGREVNVKQLCRLRCKYLRSPLDITCFLDDHSNLKRILYRLEPEDRKLAMQGCGIDGMTPLHLVAKSGNLSSLNLIAQKVKLLPLLSIKDFWGRQPLHIASGLGHKEVTFRLLELGSPSNALDELGKASVDYYLEERMRTVTESVPLENTTTSDVRPLPVGKCKYLYKPYLMVRPRSASRQEPSSLSMDKEGSEKLLKFAMMDPNCRYSHGRTFLHIAIQVTDRSTIYRLFEEGFLPDAKDDDGRTPLHYAILAGREAISEDLIIGFHHPDNRKLRHFESNAFLKDNRNITTLMLAAEKHLERVATVLLEGKIAHDINEIDSDHKSALFHAQGLDGVKFLVGKGADTVRKDASGKTRLHAALEERHSDIAIFLLQFKDAEKIQKDPFDYLGTSLLITACQQGLCEVIPTIIEKWPHTLNEADKPYGETPLAWACERGHKDVVKCLIDRGADVNKKASAWYDFTPLHICASVGQFHILNLIIQMDLRKDSQAGKRTDGRLLLEERSLRDQTPLEMCIYGQSVDGEYVEAIKGLLFHNRISPGERLRCFKMIVHVCQSDDSSELKDVFPDGFQEIVKQGSTEDFLLWLVTDQISTEAIEKSKAPATNVTAFLKPLVKAFEERRLSLQVPYALVPVLGHREVREIVKSGGIKEQERDTDGWSCATYIERYDTHESLRDLATELRKTLPIEQPDATPQAQWHRGSESFWENFQITGAGNSEFTVTKKSDSYSWACVRTEHCISPSADFYFEITILDDPGSAVIVVGFCGFDTGEDELPGWFERSWAYHSDDGKVGFDAEGVGGPNETFGAEGPDGRGDTVGVYLNTETGQGFCTKNGTKLNIGIALDKAKETLRVGKMYPCVGFGLDSDNVGLCFRVNLSGKGDYPFKYETPEEGVQLG